MVTQYPDTISIQLPDAYVQNEDTGNYEIDRKGETLTFDCRAETSTPVNNSGADTVEPTYQFTIYAEPIGVQVPVGSPYTLNRRGETYTGQIKGCVQNQMNVNLWG